MASPVPSHSERLPSGTLLDDFLDAPARQAIDRDALARLAAWRSLTSASLTVEQLDLPWVWEIELLAEVFLPETRVISGLRRVVAELAPRRLIAHGLATDLVAAIREELQVEVEVAELGPPPRYPTALGNPWAPSLRSRVIRQLLSLGLPGPGHGDFYVWPYWHLERVIGNLAAGDSALIVDPHRLPVFIGARRLAQLLGRGRFVGTAGPLDRRRARHAIQAALMRAPAPQTDVLDRLLDGRARDMLRQRAATSLAEYGAVSRSFARGAPKAILLPFDSPPDARMLVAAARAQRMRSVVVQHGGLYADPAEGDRTSADVAAVWSREAAESLVSRAAGKVVVTGNPAPALARWNAPGQHILVLGESVSRVTAQVDARMPLRHLRTALEGVAAALPGAEVVVRPHPSELDPGAFEALARSFDTLRAHTAHGGPIEPLIAAAKLCIGAISTATIQAGAAGVPVVMLNVSDRPAPWPLDGSARVLLAASAEELALAIPEALAAAPGHDDCAAALGAVPGASAAIEQLLLADRD